MQNIWFLGNCELRYCEKSINRPNILTLIRINQRDIAAPKFFHFNYFHNFNRSKVIIDTVAEMRNYIKQVHLNLVTGLSRLGWNKNFLKILVEMAKKRYLFTIFWMYQLKKNSSLFFQYLKLESWTSLLRQNRKSIFQWKKPFPPKSMFFTKF